MFKKPKRHFRQRKLTDGSDEENSEELSDINNGQNSGASHQNNNNGSKKKKEGGGESRKVKKPIAAVSFEEEGEGIAILSLCHLLCDEFTVNICSVLNRMCQ